MVREKPTYWLRMSIALGLSSDTRIVPPSNYMQSLPQPTIRLRFPSRRYHNGVHLLRRFFFGISNCDSNC